MKIVHFGKYYFPDNGGIERVTESLARGAVKAGHDVTVVCFGKKFQKGCEILKAVKVIRAQTIGNFSSQPLSLRYIFFCLSEAKKANLIHLHFPNFLAAFCALLVPRNKILIVHWHSDVLNKGFMYSLLKPLESLLLHRANIIVVTSHNYFISSKPLASFEYKVRVVPIGVSFQKSNGIKDQLPSSLNAVLERKNIILSVGRLVPYKGFQLLISAAKYLRDDSVFVIVGGGPLLQELEQSLQKAGVQHKVIITGMLDDATLEALYKRAKIYCLPSNSRAEAFGVVLLEAMSHGLPIVSSIIPGSGVSWVNQHEVSGLNVPVGDAHALADACNHIMASAGLRLKLANGSKQRYLSEFTENISLKRILDIYEKSVPPVI